MSDFRYTLERYSGMSSRYSCPNCGHNRVFVRYVDTHDNNNHLGEHVGRCGRQVECGYHYKPRDFFAANGYKPAPVRPLVSFSKESVLASPLLSSFDTLSPGDQEYTTQDNNFFYFLQTIMTTDEAVRLCLMYHCTTINKPFFKGTGFWQKDINGLFRTCKTILYNPIDGKRVKEPYHMVNYTHKQMSGNNNYNLLQCCYGEHLYNDSINTVYVVESEKTAILCEHFIHVPNAIFVSCGSINNIKSSMLQVYSRARIILVPDAGAYEVWNNKAALLSNLHCFVSERLEYLYNDGKIGKGLDIADYLIQSRTV